MGEWKITMDFQKIGDDILHRGPHASEQGSNTAATTSCNRLCSVEQEEKCNNHQLYQSMCVNLGDRYVTNATMCSVLR